MSQEYEILLGSSEVNISVELIWLMSLNVYFITDADSIISSLGYSPLILLNFKLKYEHIYQINVSRL